jgi:hypothetical protein
VNPDADELCDGIDNDCDRAIDEPGAVDGTPYYTDQDGDGYGDPTVATTGCWELSGYLTDGTDCDDGDEDVHPNAREYCNGYDDDCDGDVDEDSAEDADDWYLDSDGDGYGDPDHRRSACERPDGYTGDHTDCDDDDARINPRADEVCDGEDNDCDGVVDSTGSMDTENATWAEPGYYIGQHDFFGTVFSADQDMVLQGYSLYMAATGDLSGYIRVFEDDGGGTFDLVASDAVSIPGDSYFGWRSGEGLDVPLRAGGRYILGFGTASGYFYPAYDHSTDPPTQIGLTPQGYIEDSDATPTSLTVASVEVDRTYYQRVTVEVVSEEDRDDDGDGLTPFCGDCDDDDANAYPGAPEVCGDGLDQDCDGADEACPDSDTGSSGGP